MSKRQIRLRPERRHEIDLRRLAAAIAAMAAEQHRQEETKGAPRPKRGRKEAA